MTRREFEEEINNWYDLLNFCSDNGLYTCEDVVTWDVRDEYVNEWLRDLPRGMDWEEVLSVLDEIPRGDGYFRCDSSTDFTELDDYDDFEAYKSDVLNEAEEDGIFDEEEEDEEEEEEEPEPEEEEDLGMDLDAFLDSSAMVFASAVAACPTSSSQFSGLPF